MSLRGVGCRLAQWLSVHLPHACALRGAEYVADLWWHCAPGRRATVHQNLCMVLGTSTAQGSMSREVFRNFGRYLVEFFAIHTIRDPEVTLDGLQHLEDARHHQRGVIALTAHLGNWEVGAIMIRRMGVPTTVVAWPHGESDMDRLFNQQRARCDINVIPMGAGAARSSLRCLRDGHLLGLLGDWEFADHGLTLPVFDRPVRLPRGPALLSLRSQAPVVPTFLIREGRWKFRLCFEPAIWPDPQEAEELWSPPEQARGSTPSSFDAAFGLAQDDPSILWGDIPSEGHQSEARARVEGSIRRITQRYAEVLERYVKRFPEQWLMFHPVAG